MLSVVIVTYNPRKDVFDWSLDGIENQTLKKSEFEVLVIDNNSSTPLNVDEIMKGRTFNVRIVKEERQGNVFSRYRGILEAKYDLIVFCDDDNRFAPNYLEEVKKIAVAHPEFGTFGGKLLAKMECKIPEWKKVFLGYLGVRDFGDEPITSNENCWGKWEAPTAGMAFRKEVGLEYVKFIDNFPDAGKLGRKVRKKKSNMLSCEDSLLVRLSYPLGYYASYQPTLCLEHYMKKFRFTNKYLCRLMEGFGRSQVILETILGNPIDKPNTKTIKRDLCRRLLWRLKTQGRAGLIMWFWDLGFSRQAREGFDFSYVKK